MSQPIRLRPAVLTVSTASLVVLGAWYGARLKENQEIKKVRTISSPLPTLVSGNSPSSPLETSGRAKEAGWRGRGWSLSKSTLRECLSGRNVYSNRCRKRQLAEKWLRRRRSLSSSRQDRALWLGKLGWRTRFDSSKRDGLKLKSRRKWKTGPFEMDARFNSSSLADSTYEQYGRNPSRAGVPSRFSSTKWGESMILSYQKNTRCSAYWNP